MEKNFNKTNKKRTILAVVFFFLVVPVLAGIIGSMAKLTNNFKDNKKVTIEQNYKNWKKDMNTGWNNLFNKKQSEVSDNDTSISENNTNIPNEVVEDEINIRFGFKSSYADSEFLTEDPDHKWLNNKELYIENLNKMLNSKTLYSTDFNSDGTVQPIYFMKEIDVNSLKIMFPNEGHSILIEDSNNNFYKVEYNYVIGLAIPITREMIGIDFEYVNKEDPEDGFNFNQLKKLIYAEGDIFTLFYKQTPREYLHENEHIFFVNK